MALTAEQLQAWKDYCKEWADLYAAEVVAKPPYDKFGPQPDLRAAIQFQIAHSQEQWLESYGILVTTLTNQGYVDPNSGNTNGANENMGDSQMQKHADGTPGFIWYGGTDKNGVAFRVAVADMKLINEHPRSWYWRSNVYCEIGTNRYAYAMQSILKMAADGIVNPSGA